MVRNTELDMEIVSRVASSCFGCLVTPERTKSGYSTYVYRVLYDEKTYYMRILPENGSFAPEALAHNFCLGLGVSVPRVMYYEHKNAALGKSVMITDEIRGESLDNCGGTAETLIEAGRQLALINTVPVDGFGWIDRSNYFSFRGEHADFEKFFYSDDMRERLEKAEAVGFDAKELTTLLNKGFALLNTDEARLIHGDFDNSHIFQIDGRYSGIIDFGEIEGGHKFHDLGHYKAHSSDSDFVNLAKGYAQICPLSVIDYMKIEFLGFFVALSRFGGKHYNDILRREIDALKKHELNL